MPNTFLYKEFDRQINTLLEKKYPQLAGISTEVFIEKVQQLKSHLTTVPSNDMSMDEGKLPFVIVVKHSLLDTQKAVSLTFRDGKQSFTNMYPHTPDEFSPIPSLALPDSDIYVLVDIDRGKNTLNIRPDEALEMIVQQNRSPLTIDEGVAILTHYPQFLQKNNCFSLLGSRMKNQRVPALWITREKSVRLGWCWERNPHTWLGSASCASRLA